MPTKDNIIEEDFVSDKEQELFEAYDNGENISPNNNYVAFEGMDVVEFAHIFEPTLASKQNVLHRWQLETISFIAQKGQWTKQDFLEFILAANNGSGKDAFVIAILAVFFSCTIVRHRFIVSTASYNQLSRQTIPYMAALAGAVNKEMWRRGLAPPEEKVFIIKRDHIVSPVTGAEIVPFVTDDPLRAEGFHPWNDCPTQELMICLNECKSIPDEMFGAFRKCTYNRWLEVSSTGVSSGHFYSKFHSAIPWEEYQAIEDSVEKNKHKSIARRITAYDCPHISPRKIEAAKDELGEDSPLFKTTFLSLFVSLEGLIVIEPSLVEANRRAKIAVNTLCGVPRRAGLDLAAGGDENVLTVIQYNQVLAIRAFTLADTNLAAKIIVKLFEEYELEADNIFADDGGVGRGILNDLRELGWGVRRILNNSPAIHTRLYQNLGAELYFNAAEIIKKQVIDFSKVTNNSKFFTQLSSRFLKQSETQGKLALESKREAKKQGHPSPDRADSFVLSLTGLTWKDFVREIGEQDNRIGGFNSSRYSVKDAVRRLMLNKSKNKFANLLPSSNLYAARSTKRLTLASLITSSYGKRK